MIFNEVFGAYTRTIGLIINDAVKQNGISWSDILNIINGNAFYESADYIRKMINPSDDVSAFPLIKKNQSTRKYSSILSKEYKRPMTIFELRWLKAISLDPRIKLFSDNFPELEGVEPLFKPGDIIYYDQNSTSDDFENPIYIANFRATMKAIKENREIEITNNGNKSFTVTPLKLEYSQKDNRFRLVTISEESSGIAWYVNLSSIKKVQLLGKATDSPERAVERVTSKAVLEIWDEKNAMERISLSFSHLERTTERIDKIHYKLTVTYGQSDRAEMIIRIMSFGKYVKVLEPEEIREEINLRLKNQMKLLSCR